MNGGCMFEEWVRKIAWLLLTGLITYAVGEIKSISQSLNSLNTTVTLLTEKLNVAGEASKEYKLRMDSLEKVVFSLEKDILTLKQKIEARNK